MYQRVLVSYEGGIGFCIGVFCVLSRIFNCFPTVLSVAGGSVLVSIKSAHLYMSFLMPVLVRMTYDRLMIPYISKSLHPSVTVNEINRSINAYQANC